MNKNTKIILIVIIIVLLGGLGYFGYVYGRKYLKKNLPAIKDFAQRVITPDPLTGPVRSSSTDILNSGKIIEETNYHRNTENLSDLSKSESLTKAAEDKVDDMFKNQYFEHISPVDGRDVTYWVGEVSYNYALVGENLALGDFKSEVELVQAWMDSPGHRENIMNSQYTEIGVAAKKGIIEGRNTWLAVQIFAKPSPNCTPPDANIKADIEKKQAEYEQIKDLNNQIDKLQSEGKDLMNQGNVKNDEGNKIFSETGDKSKAQPYWDEGETLYNAGKVRLDQANELINQANSLSSLHDEIQKLIDQYNQEVDSYNKCLSL